MRFSHEGANARAGAHPFFAIKLDGVRVFGDVLSFNGSITFDGFDVGAVNLCYSIF